MNHFLHAFRSGSRGFVRVGLALLVGTAVLGTTGGRAEDPPPSVDAAARLRGQLDASVAWNEFTRGGGGADESGRPFAAAPVHRWTNNERDPNGQGVLIVWSDAGRPAVAASLYPWNGNLVHELECLARRPIQLRRDGEVVWRPETGLAYRPVPGAPVPDAKPAGRLRQMKELADRFTVTMLGWKDDDSDREVLRRLPKELFRHKPEEADVLDGAMFGYVKGTDPEALLIVEAVPASASTGEARFEYAFVRATSGGLQAALGDEIVWTAVKHASRRDPAGLSFSIGRPLEE